MQTISVRTTQNVAIQYPLASVGDRIISYLLDRIILTLYSVGAIAIVINYAPDIWWLWIVLLVLPWLFYDFFFEIFMNGQTPAKRVMKIQVVRIDGSEPTVGDYSLRWVFSLVDFHVLSGAIAVLVIAVGGKGQRLGDVVAGTCVVKLIEQSEVTASEIFIAPSEDYRPTFPQVMQLETRDIELVQRALEAWRDHDNEKPVLLVTERVKSLLGIQTDLPAGEFLHTIVKDFNYLTSR
jgi:uncharacterized RDD family membrane protein YckC